MDEGGGRVEARDSGTRKVCWYGIQRRGFRGKVIAGIVRRKSRCQWRARSRTGKNTRVPSCTSYSYTNCVSVGISTYSARTNAPAWSRSVRVLCWTSRSTLRTSVVQYEYLP